MNAARPQQATARPQQRPARPKSVVLALVLALVLDAADTRGCGAPVGARPSGFFLCSSSARLANGRRRIHHSDSRGGVMGRSLRGRAAGACEVEHPNRESRLVLWSADPFGLDLSYGQRIRLAPIRTNMDIHRQLSQSSLVPLQVLHMPCLAYIKSKSKDQIFIGR
ncbi:uncharacterized protein SCHCODRAFT_02274536 [Schizophyllum commune H4-8]|uniref:uncharacterized protein n=1 Tax=Schizophyllum commune (strain H4-8 / FGSC 9210) TaxID=578458 RepID=UPI002160E902|nr:uncharacterized protein SCHCODRAFT_02274536 [Schizophyllum commune H4-8]KAI5894347.1 hypothetical protein SCHCODRAFT_02274536 [Schizophyllum commune H4-8]